MSVARSASRRLVAIVVSCVLLAGTGCVSHAPMSETVMFREPVTSPRHTAVAATGGSITVPISDRQRLLTKRLPDRPNPDLWRMEPNVGAYLAVYDKKGAFAFSATAGYFLAGLDATVRLLPATYLTGALSYDAGQVYLQRRVYNHQALGAAIGAGYRRVRLFTSDYDNSAMFATDEIPLNLIGLRPHALFRMTDKHNIGLRVALFGGFTVQEQDPYVSLSLTVGGF